MERRANGTRTIGRGRENPMGAPPAHDKLYIVHTHLGIPDTRIVIIAGPQGTKTLNFPFAKKITSRQASLHPY